MDPADALRAAEIGCDGIIVSNHGGRQFDQAPASLDVLPAIKAAVGERMTVMLDSGVRRGGNIDRGLRPTKTQPIEAYPEPPLLPTDPLARAWVRGLALINVADSHPLIVPRVRHYLTDVLKVSDDQRLASIQHWLGAGVVERA